MWTFQKRTYRFAKVRPKDQTAFFEILFVIKESALKWWLLVFWCHEYLENIYIFMGFIGIEMYIFRVNIYIYMIWRHFWSHSVEKLYYGTVTVICNIRPVFTETTLWKKGFVFFFTPKVFFSPLDKICICYTCCCTKCERNVCSSVRVA